MSWTTLQPEEQTPSDDKPLESDRTPTGEELLEMGSRRSRLRSLLKETERDENLDGLHGEVRDDASHLQRTLKPPEGHAVQGMPPGPEVTTVQPVGLDAGSLAAAGLMGGIIVAETIGKVHDIIERWKERR